MLSSGAYLIYGAGGGYTPPYNAYCDMETAGGGWTLAMTVNPADGSSAAYNNFAFWVDRAEYGSFDTFASRDYKGPSAYTLEGDELMTKFVAFGTQGTQESDLAAGIKEWWVRPMLETATVGSMFGTHKPS